MTSLNTALNLQIHSWIGSHSSDSFKFDHILLLESPCVLLWLKRSDKRYQTDGPSVMAHLSYSSLLPVYLIRAKHFQYKEDAKWYNEMIQYGMR